MRALLHTDGGTRKGNPGKASIGYVVYKAGTTQVLSQGYGLIGYTTNNVAEYMALIAGLKKVLSMGLKEVSVRADSQLVIDSIRLGWEMKKSPHLRILRDEALELLGRFDSYNVKWVPRKLNSVADGLCRIAFREKWPE